jgi:tripartite-type tricarboxylate transporter receptor subunit TctC
MRPLSYLLATGVLLAGFTVTAEQASSGNWPERTVRIITPFNPGISVDVAARTLADALSKQWKQPVVVENRPGADTMIGTQAFLEMRDNHAHSLPRTARSPSFHCCAQKCLTTPWPM